MIQRGFIKRFASLVFVFSLVLNPVFAAPVKFLAPPSKVSVEDYSRKNEIINNLKQIFPESGDDVFKYLKTLSLIDLEYYSTCVMEYIKSISHKQDNPILDINAEASSTYPAKKQQEEFGRINNKDLEKEYQSKLSDLLHDVAVESHSMDGGLGSAIVRDEYLAARGKKREIGAKATDILVPTKSGSKDSIAKFKLENESYAASKYGYKLTYSPLVNKDSAPWYKKLFEYVFGNGQKYKDTVKGDFYFQGDYPVVDNLNKKKLRIDKKAPGGHAFWGFMLLKSIYAYEQKQGDSKVYIDTFKNGDGINNDVPPHVLAWMKEKNIPMIMVTTSRTRTDKKGGIIILWKRAGKYIRSIFEKAQAVAAGQLPLFYSIGIDYDKRYETKIGKDTGRAGDQMFNTNTFAFNKTVLSGILRELEAIIGKEELNRVIMPDIMRKVQEKLDASGKVVDSYTQLEGAIASVFFNLCAYIETSNDSRVKEILSSRNLERLGYLVNFDVDERIRVFSPTKNAFDVYFLLHSGRFVVDETTYRLVDAQPNEPYPFVSFPVNEGKREDDAENPYYKNLQTCINAFSGSLFRGLTSLVAIGPLMFDGVVLSNDVDIVNRTDQNIVLKDLNNKSFLEEYMVKCVDYNTEEPRTPVLNKDNKLEFNNVKIVIQKREATIPVMKDNERSL